MTDMPKDLRRVRKLALAAGWTVTPTRSSHMDWRSPDGTVIIVTPSTPPDTRSYRNTLAWLRAAGLEA